MLLVEFEGTDSLDEIIWDQRMTVESMMHFISKLCIFQKYSLRKSSTGILVYHSKPIMRVENVIEVFYFM
jgi:hypothetical protein